MVKRTLAVQVGKTKAGTIVIRQQLDKEHHLNVEIHPSQVPSLVQWLQDIAKEIEAEEDEIEFGPGPGE